MNWLRFSSKEGVAEFSSWVEQEAAKLSEAQDLRVRRDLPGSEMIEKIREAKPAFTSLNVRREETRKYDPVTGERAAILIVGPLQVDWGTVNQKLKEIDLTEGERRGLAASFKAWVTDVVPELQVHQPHLHEIQVPEAETGRISREPTEVEIERGEVSELPPEEPEVLTPAQRRRREVLEKRLQRYREQKLEEAPPAPEYYQQLFRPGDPEERTRIAEAIFEAERVKGEPLTEAEVAKVIKDVRKELRRRKRPSPEQISEALGKPMTEEELRGQMVEMLRERWEAQAR